jgi:glycosyltransferase involved in cell wall biosynthesis
MLQALGITVTSLNMTPNWPSPLAIYRMARLLRREKPDVVQTWMYHADLFGGLIARLVRIDSVIWGIRHSVLEPGKSKKTTIWIAKLLAKLSWWLPVKIVICSRQAIEVHAELGYDRDKMYFIPNGYDLTVFQPKIDLRDKTRVSFVTDQSIPLIGTIGRFDPQKDHINLLNSLAILRQRGIIFQCIFVGTGLESSNTQIMDCIIQLGLTDYVKLLGPRIDIPNILNVLDLFVLPSSAEAFPNVVAEAMACGTPCVVTDVGDAAFIVGDSGWVVPPRDATALTEAIIMALQQVMNSNQRKNLSSRARSRIEDHFSIQCMVKNYTAIWNDAIHK